MLCNVPILAIVPKALLDTGDYDYSDSIPNETSPNGLAVISISGVIGKKLSDYDKQTGMVDVDDIYSAIESAVASPVVQTVLLLINSPGGEVTGVPELCAFIMEASQVKNIFAFTDTVIGSAAYWIASCTNGIFVTPSSEVGSIGAFTLFEDHSKELEQAGIAITTFSAGKYKLLGSPFKPMTKEESDLVQGNVDNIYNQFTSTVNANRGGVNSDVMQGQLFNGTEAVENNLADMVVQSIQDVVSFLDVPLQPQPLDTTSNNNN